MNGLSNFPHYFLGRWAFDRRIDDRLAGLTGRVTGEAAFEPGADGLARLDYAETGTLDYGGRRSQASQRYAWVFLGPERVEILNSEGAPLCVVDLAATGVAWACHLCGEDHYETRILVEPTGWRQIWRVAGPRKDYLSETAYRRA